MNQYLSQLFNNAAFVSTASNQGSVDLNSLQILSSLVALENGSNYYQQGSQFLQINNSDNGNYNLNIFNTPSTIPAPIGFDNTNQYLQNQAGNDINNYNVQSSGNFEMNNINYGDNSNNDQYNLGIASQNGNEYLQQNEMQNPTGIYGNIVNYANSNSTMTFADQQVINNYGDAAYSSSQINNNQAVHSYVDPAQSVSYNYSYTMPAPASSNESHL